MNYYIGVDLGGTSIKVSLVDPRAQKIMNMKDAPTNAPRAPHAVAADIVNLVFAVIGEAGVDMDRILWIGVAVPGIVKNGTILSAVNLGWKNVPFAMLLERMSGKEVYLANDANAAAYAEAVWGVGRGRSALACLTLGTGVGGGMVINGKIWDGFNGFAAEIGHMIIDSNGRECGCGKRGCLEAYCSARAIVREAVRMMNLYTDSALHRLCGGDISRVNPKMVFDAANEGDYAASSVVNSYIDYLAVGVSNVINLFQPSVVCIGGGISAQGDALLVPLCDRVRRLSFGFENGRTTVMIAKYKNDAGMIGAALLGLDKMREENMKISEKISARFMIEGEVINATPHGNGHINDTYLVTTRVNGGEKKYILQKINKNVFKAPELLMKNFAAVTKYLMQLSQRAGKDPTRDTLCIIPTTDGRDYFVSADGDYWRMLVYVENSVCYDRIERPEQFYESGLAFGNFQYLLRDYPAETLYETIANFHNTADRYRLLFEAADADAFGRRESVAKELEFAKERYEFASKFERLHREGKLPLRVTHNDTKLNNILFDKDSGKPVCVIDLDTIMPGYSVNDFGDSIRFGATTAAEDEADLSLVNFDISLFELHAKGFIEGARGGLCECEIDLLPDAAIMMTLECGMRFLTDYLSGDTYFKTSRRGQNLDRARNQFKLVSDMEKQLDKMREIISKYK